MNRVRTQRQAEAIAAALDYIPDRLLPLTGCDIFCADPWFAGVHDLREADNGETVELRAHAVNESITRDRRRVICIPEEVEVVTVLHEMAHIIDYTLWDRTGGRHLPRMEPINAYAENYYGEAFAESFVQWLYGAEMVNKLLVERPHMWDRWSRENDEWWDRLLLQ